MAKAKKTELQDFPGTVVEGTAQEVMEAVAEAEKLAPTPPIAGLTPGRMVHTIRGGKLRAGVVAEVHDAIRGDITAVIFEPELGNRPQHPPRLSYAGDGAEPSEGQWAWMYNGQATQNYAGPHRSK